MKNLVSTIAFCIISVYAFSQGCTVSAAINRDTIVCGENASLSAFGQAQGIALLSENFNSGSYGPGWQSTQQAMWNNPCSPGGADGTTHIWMGNSSPVPRALTTTSFNLSSCANAGVTICFDMLFATQCSNCTAPCEGPDEPLEGVYLQYSIDNGATWTTLNYFDPNGGSDPQLINWNNWCFPVPVAALTSNTKFRWFQDADSGADYDHWGIDNVVIYCNDPSYNIVWVHDGYNAGPNGGVNPTPVSPNTTTNYVVNMSNGTNTCSDTVRLVVVNPTIVVNAGNDTTICSGQCLQLNATAKIVQRPAKTPTYRNQEIAPITGTPGLPGFPPIIPATPGRAFLAMDINVTNLNLNTVPSNYISSVCIGNMTMSFFGGVDLFDIWLVCPSGDSILLVKDSTISGTSLTNTCFVPAGPPITSGSSPYSGNYAPNQPFNNLVGCDANGVWSLHFNAIFNGFSLPTGSFNSWTITFNDPEVAYTGNFTWSPTGNMTNSNTLTPTVCPPPGTFTLTVSDTAGCVTQSDVINVNTQACCALSASAATTQPTCGQSNGAINITPVPAGSYTFAWSDGLSTQQNRTGLPAGTYTVTVTSTSTPTCTFDTTIVLNSNSNLAVTFGVPTQPTCAGNDGSVQVTLSGGTPLYQITIDTGGAPVNQTSPVAGSLTIPSLGAGTINVSVTDGQGCLASATVTLVAPTNCCQLSATTSTTQPSCGQTNGAINVNPTPAGSYTYAWSDGPSTQQNRTGLGAGTYSVTITSTSIPTCTFTTSVTLASPGGPTLTFSNPVNPSCAGGDGSVTVTLAGGTGPYTITIDTGSGPFTVTSPIAGQLPLPGLDAGTYTASVQDANSCSSNASVTLTAPANCCTHTVSAVLVQPTCGQADGSITLTASNGSGNYSYAWGGGQNTSFITGIPSGSYTVTITDNAFANCAIDTLFPLNDNSTLVLTLTGPINPSCAGDDGQITVNLSGGSAPYSAEIDTTGGTPVPVPFIPGPINQSFTGLPPGAVTVTVTDAVGCQAVASVTLATPICCTIQADAVVTPPSCGLSNASVTVNITTAGVQPYTYSFNGGAYQAQNTFGNLAPGNYTVIAKDLNDCADTVLVTVPTSANSLQINIVTTDVSCFGAADGVVTANVAGGSTPYLYQWSGGTNDSTQTGLIPGTYTVTVADASNCTGSATAFITEPPLLTIDLGNDTTACEGTPINLSAPAGFTGYLWSGGETTQTILPTVAGTYAVTVTDANNCTATDAVDINLVPMPMVDLGDDKLVYEGQNTGIFAVINQGNGSGGTYNWMPDTLLSCNDCQNPVAYAADTITYMLVYTDNYGCTGTDAIVLNVLKVGDIFWPNAFSPNGDGNNDVFLPYGSGVKQIKWGMYNRWGEKVFESTNFFYGCDGTYKGAPLPAGVYVYTADVVMMNDRSLKYKGSVTLIR